MSTLISVPTPQLFMHERTCVQTTHPRHISISHTYKLLAYHTLVPLIMQCLPRNAAGRRRVPTPRVRPSSGPGGHRSSGSYDIWFWSCGAILSAIHRRRRRPPQPAGIHATRRRGNLPSAPGRWLGSGSGGWDAAPRPRMAALGLVLRRPGGVPRGRRTKLAEAPAAARSHSTSPRKAQ